MPTRILVVDDDATSRDLLSYVLAAVGYQVFTANDGQEGLAAAKSQRPELIITDIAMPHLDGVEMIRRLREEADFGNVPILVLTAFASGSQAAALEAGADHAIQKPVDVDGMLRAVEKLLAPVG